MLKKDLKEIIEQKPAMLFLLNVKDRIKQYYYCDELKILIENIIVNSKNN